MNQNQKLWFYNFLTRILPERCSHLRVKVLRICGVSCADTVRLSSGTTFHGEGKFCLGEGVVIRGDVRMESILEDGEISVGDFVEVNHGSYLAANGGTKLLVGKYCKIAHFVSLKTSSHRVDVGCDCIAGETYFSDIVLGEGSWLCAGAIILPGVKLGKRNVVAAGAVVTKDTADNVLMAGVPAVEKKRYC